MIEQQPFHSFHNKRKNVTLNARSNDHERKILFPEKKHINTGYVCDLITKIKLSEPWHTLGHSVWGSNLTDGRLNISFFVSRD